MKRSTGCLAAAATVALAFGASPVWANSVMEPGETAGLAAYAPLPEGGYFLNLGNFGDRTTHPSDTALTVDIPAFVWSTPWTVLGGRVEFLAATPVVGVGVGNSDKGSDLALWNVYYPFLQPIIAWDLGNGFSVGGGVGAYIGVHNSVTNIVVGNESTLRYNLGVNYIADNITLAATAKYEHPIDIDHTNINADHGSANIDLTAYYSVGKWQFGVVGYGTLDTSRYHEYNPVYLANTPHQSGEFAVGPLVGYNFGPVILQAKVTRDVAIQWEGGWNTVGWTNLVIPLWGAPPPPPPPPTLAPPPPAPQVQPAKTYLVFFDWDRADLTSRARQIISEAAQASTHVQVTKIYVNGYTDTSGTPRYNQALSVRRATNVANELVSDGVSRGEIEIKGFGESHPLVPTGPGVREPQNRRVEIILS
jgi:outer membrane protein OmpA-like peptidoglycan-associated protein